MNYFTIFVVLATVLTLSYAFVEVNKEAEIVPAVRNESSDGTGTANEDPIIIVNLRPFRPVFGDLDPISRLFNRIFRGSFPLPPVSDTDVLDIPSFSSGPSDFDDTAGPSLRDLIFNFPRARFPDLSSYPDNYDNSTHEVRVVNGTKIEVNRTISKNKGDGGFFVQEVQIVRYSPEKEQDGPSDVPPEADTKDSAPADTPKEPSHSVATDTKPHSGKTKPESEDGFEDFGPN